MGSTAWETGIEHMRVNLIASPQYVVYRVASRFIYAICQISSVLVFESSFGVRLATYRNLIMIFSTDDGVSNKRRPCVHHRVTSNSKVRLSSYIRQLCQEVHHVKSVREC